MKDDAEHFMRCPTCGGLIDMRDLAKCSSTRGHCRIRPRINRNDEQLPAYLAAGMIRCATSRCCFHGSVTPNFSMAALIASSAVGASTVPSVIAGVLLSREMRH